MMHAANGRRAPSARASAQAASYNEKKRPNRAAAKGAIQSRVEEKSESKIGTAFANAQRADSRSIAVYDGKLLIGQVVESEPHRLLAFDAEGALIGQYRSPRTRRTVSPEFMNGRRHGSLAG